MQLKSNFSLKKFNTFGIEANAEHFVTIRTLEELKQVLTQNTLPVHILGGGSNILLTGDVQGLTLKVEIGGIAIIGEDETSVLVAAGAGVIWHELVQWTLDQNLGGLENLSLIPGCAGAAPIQNIGAYGVELKDIFDHLEAIELSSGKLQIFSWEQCRFGYRDSIFKNELKGKYCITKIVVRLSKVHRLNTGYGDIQRTLAAKGIEKPTIRDVSQAVIQIRSSKLPDPAEMGNAGSFFKNPEITTEKFEQLREIFPDIAHFELPNGSVKVPAGWLIEKAGWKGKRFGNAGCHTRQALVLVNYGSATGEEVLALAGKIQASVQERFDILLTPEVNIW